MEKSKPILICVRVCVASLNAKSNVNNNVLCVLRFSEIQIYIVLLFIYSLPLLAYSRYSRTSSFDILVNNFNYEREILKINRIFFKYSHMRCRDYRS